MSDKSKTLRVDELLVQQGFCETRSQAQHLIHAGKVYLNEEPIIKASKKLSVDSPLQITSPQKYVSRAGTKLEGFIEKFNIDVKEMICLDVGASTGGFTDCLLQKGAAHVTCVDVGHSQLHSKILNNTKVFNIEKLNARNLTQEDLPYSNYDVVVVDVSFISLKKVLPNLLQFLKLKGLLISLIKPQFEVTKQEIAKAKGIIKDPKMRERIVKDITQFCSKELGEMKILGIMESIISGADGNVEYLIGLYRGGYTLKMKA